MIRHALMITSRADDYVIRADYQQIFIENRALYFVTLHNTNSRLELFVIFSMVEWCCRSRGSFCVC